MFLELGDDILRAIRMYGTRKAEMNLVDFDDLLLLWRDLLKRDEIAQSQRALWRDILVDEYQDTNILQAEIVDEIAGPDGNLMVVGDDAQSIYSFRGANFGNIIDFPKRHPKARVFKLETNYRSTPEILALANSSISHNARQFPKVLAAVRKPGPLPERVTCGDVREQADFTSQRIRLQDEGALRDIAVLYHATNSMAQMERRGASRSDCDRASASSRRRTSRTSRRTSRSRQPARRDGIKARGQPTGSGAPRRTRSGTPCQDPGAASRGTGAGVLKAVPSATKPGGKSLDDPARDRGPDLRQAPAEMIRTVLESGYQDYLQATFPNHALRVEDVKRLADYSNRFVDIQELLAELALAGPSAGQQAPEEPEEKDELVLTTVHQAKGLEWRAVFVLWLADGKLPDARAMREDDGVEEERRLFYVACTRAKDLLYLAHPVVADERSMSSVFQRASMFLVELDKETYEQSNVGYQR
jgi:DNA helicase-2/ATP-dependent DNA helicase PcrA